MSRASVLVVLAVSALPALASAQPVADRYGPAAGPAVSGPYAAGAPAQLRGRMLNWPGKTTAQAGISAPSPYQAQPRAAASPASDRYAAPRYAAAAAPNRGYAAPRAYAAAPVPSPTASRPSADMAQDGWRPVFASASPPTLAGPPARPTSIYAPPTAARAAAAAPPRGAPASQRYGYDPTQTHRVRLYSVARPFGLQPDPAPIPPQFFTNTADLADPPAQLPLERSATAGSTTSSTRSVRAVPDTSTN